ncbi:DgyrCDS9591 [Dimorphilus gyrociliatus]|uniref:Glutamine amidotransferase-like class 1 domain-containing protein 1 n=1 Tax=Dimorphilus gyrociliatus TaxID=2664684 RepID=A0A7I8VYV0_9ANNE|nr:DgyrCDS9591 [Dimorphilus gyrociliatus]
MSRQACLIVLSSAIEGVNIQSFMQAFSLLNTSFNIDLASPNGRLGEFIGFSEEAHKWLADFKTKPQATPIMLKSISVDKYSALVIPDAPGAHFDLAHDEHMAEILHDFMREKKLICAISNGVSGLFPAKKNNTWIFNSYSMTCTPLVDLVRASLVQDTRLTMPQDFIVFNGGSYAPSSSSSTTKDSSRKLHVVIDNNLITAATVQSTLIAIQNVILLSNPQ